MTTPFIQFQNVSHTYDKTAINGPFAVEEIHLDVNYGFGKTDPWFNHD